MAAFRTALISGLLGVLCVAPPLASAGSGAVSPVNDDIAAAAAALRKQAGEDALAARIVRSLTTEIGPRFAGSSGDTAAVAWALNEFKTLGFSNVHAESVTVPHWIRGTAQVSITAPDPHRLAATALAGSAGTPESGIKAPVVTVATATALKNLNRDDVAGKIVYLSARMRASADGAGYRAVLANVRDGAAIAAAKGAVALVVRSLGTDSNRLPHTGWTKFASPANRIPALAISTPDANLLDIELTKGAPVVLGIRSTARDLPPARSANVVGDIPGNGAADEIILLGAHLDSWDLGTGALDNAAGVATVLSAAHLIRSLPRNKRPRRTIRVVLFANAEFGGTGAQAYAARHADDLNHVVLAVDAPFGGVPIWRFDTGVARDVLPRTAAIARLLAPLNILNGDSDFTGDIDTRPLFMHGVPVVRLLPDARRYYDISATANDTLDKIDFTALKQNVAAYATLAYMAAAMKQDFGRAPAATSLPKEP